MHTGKVNETILKRSVLKYMKHRRPEVIVLPAVGEDCAVLKPFGGEQAMMVHTHTQFGPAGAIALTGIYPLLNSLAVRGAKLAYVTLSIMIPCEAQEQELRCLVEQLAAQCAAHDAEIIDGHTEVTPAVSDFAVTMTGIGFGGGSGLQSNQSLRPKDAIVMTKWAGLSGTAIISKLRADELRARYNDDFIKGAQRLSENLSAEMEAAIARQFDISAIHDIANGGIFGALWEVAAAGKVGLFVDLKKIPLKQETVEICDYYDINPYQLESYGALLIGTSEGERLCAALRREGVSAEIIGHFESGHDRIIANEDERRYLDLPKGNELLKIYDMGGKHS